VGGRIDPVRELLKENQHLSVLQILSSALPYLSNSEREAAQFILNSPERAVNLSAAALASESGVSEATIFRLCRQLGFNGYVSLRNGLREALDRYERSFLEPLAAPFDRDSHHGVVHEIGYAGIRALLDACSISEEDVDRAARAICSAERIILSGVGAYTARIAGMAEYGLRRLGLTCMLWVNAEAANVELHMIRPSDVIIGLSYSGGNDAVARLMEFGNRASATTVAVTNYRYSPIAQLARIALITSVRESGIQNFELLPRIAQLLAVQMLIAAVQRHLQKKGDGQEPSRRDEQRFEHWSEHGYGRTES